MAQTRAPENSEPQDPNRTFSSELTALLRLIRLGLPSNEAVVAAENAGLRQKGEIDRLLTWLESRIATASSLDVVRFRTMRAEAEYNFGLAGTAAADLHAVLSADSTGIRPALDRWSPGQPFRPRAGNRRLKREVWALMADAFYFDYLSGQPDVAREALEKLREIINTQLAAPTAIDGDPCFGTLARVHELLAQVYRTLRDFTKSEQHFADAIRYMDLRLQSNLHRAKDLAERQDAYVFSVVCTARVLGGIGRIAMLQGRLRRAQLLLATAAALLRPTGQEALKAVLASHLANTERRLCAPADSLPDSSASDAWRQRCDAIVTLKASFAERFDNDGVRRCLQELALASLDEAELSEGSARAAALKKADGHIGELQETARSQRSREWKRVERFKVHVLTARRLALLTPPDIAAATTELEEAERVRADFPIYRKDLAVSDNVDAKLTGCIVEAEGAIPQGAVRESADKLMDLARSARAAQDPVLEGEATLRAGLVHARAGNDRHASQLLELWHTQLAARVDNAFLHRLAERVATAVSAPTLSVDTSDLSVESHTRRIEELLCERAMLQTREPAKIAKLLKLSKKDAVAILERLANRQRAPE